MKDSRPIAVFDGYWGPNWKVSFEYNLNSFFGPEIRSGWGSILQVSGPIKLVTLWMLLHVGKTIDFVALLEIDIPQFKQIRTDLSI